MPHQLQSAESATLTIPGCKALEDTVNFCANKQVVDGHWYKFAPIAKSPFHTTAQEQYIHKSQGKPPITYLIYAHPDGMKFVYTYDQRHRVTNGTLKDSGNNNLRTFGYTYDLANNLTAKTRTVTSPASSDSWVYAYDNANEQTSVTQNGGTPETRTYDAWGRMATRTQGALSGTFGYRYGGKLYSYTGNFGSEVPETMQYRGDGRLYSRVSGTATKVYRYDRGWNAINEENAAGNLTATSVYAPGAAVGERLTYTWGALSNGLTAYAYHDQLGSTRAWRWQNKGLIGANDFGPYGEPYVKSTVVPIDYALHVQDPYTGNFHAPYREYSAGWARWTTRDPLGMVDGPNMYAYVKNGPTGGVDPLGLWGDDVHGCYSGYDYTFWTYPLSPWGLPGHFRSRDAVEPELEAAVQNCNQALFMSRMHQGQDTFSHYDPGWRTWMFGHLAGWTAPDNTALHQSALQATNNWTTRWEAKWRARCSGSFGIIPNNVMSTFANAFR